MEKKKKVRGEKGEDEKGWVHNQRGPGVSPKMRIFTRYECKGA